MGLADRLGDGLHGPGFYMAKFGFRSVVSFLLLLYFFKRNVLSYFGLQEINKPKAISILVARCIAIAALVAAPEWLGADL